MRSARRAAALLGLAVVAGGTLALLAGPASGSPAQPAASDAPAASTATAPAPTFTYTQAGTGPLGTGDSSFSPAAGTVKVPAGSTVTVLNSGSADLALSGTLVGAGKSATLHAGQTGALLVPSAASYPTTFTLSGVEASASLIGNTTASTDVTATSPPASSPAPSASASAPRSTGSAPAGGAAPPAASSSPGSSLRATPGLVGTIPSAQVPGAAPADGLAPEVAPYLTPTPTDSSVPPSASASPTRSPAATTFTAGGPSSSGRSLGLPAAVTGVVLLGVAATVGKLLLAHPAARAVARHR